MTKRGSPSIREQPGSSGWQKSVTIIKRLLNGEQVTFAGRHYRVTGHTIAPRPAQKPHPPILIGGNGRLLLALAAREADIVGFSGLTFRKGGAAPPDLSGWLVSGVDERVQLVREAAGDARYARLELNALVQLVVVTNDRRQAAEELARRWTQLTPDEILQSPYVLIGTITRWWKTSRRTAIVGASPITLSMSPAWTPSPPSLLASPRGPVDDLREQRGRTTLPAKHLEP